MKFINIILLFQWKPSMKNENFAIVKKPPLILQNAQLQKQWHSLWDYFNNPTNCATKYGILMAQFCSDGTVFENLGRHKNWHGYKLTQIKQSTLSMAESVVRLLFWCIRGLRLKQQGVSCENKLELVNLLYWLVSLEGLGAVSVIIRHPSSSFLNKVAKDWIKVK